MVEPRLREIEAALGQGVTLTLTAAELLELVRAAREAERLRGIVRSVLWSAIQRVDAALERLPVEECAVAGDPTKPPHDWTAADHLAAVEAGRNGGERG